jgi:hypothetical protein
LNQSQEDFRSDEAGNALSDYQQSDENSGNRIATSSSCCLTLAFTGGDRLIAA